MLWKKKRSITSLYYCNEKYLEKTHIVCLFIECKQKVVGMVPSAIWNAIKPNETITAAIVTKLNIF